MVPHAGLKYSGKIAAAVWRSLELPPRTTLLIISPKHTSRGVNWAVCPQAAWALSATTTIDADVELAQRIAESVTGFELDSAAHAEEHGIEVQLPLIERVAPDARVVGLAMQGGSWSEIQQAAAQLASCIASLDRRPHLIISSDLNHYADDAENRRRDRWALDALAAGRSTSAAGCLPPPRDQHVRSHPRRTGAGDATATGTPPGNPVNWAMAPVRMSPATGRGWSVTAVCCGFDE